MKSESRVQKSITNAKVNTICYFLALMISFFSRKIFIDHLGTEFLGFSTTAYSLLGFLNIAELGVGSAVAYVLYKPLFENNKIAIVEIISVLGYIYRMIGLLILTLGIIVSLFLPIIFSDTQISLSVIYLGFYAYLFSSLLGYFANYKQTLLNADQRQYEVNGYYQVCILGKTIVQMLLVISYNNFYLFFFIEIVFGIIYSFILNYRIQKVYPWLEANVKEGYKLFSRYPEIVKYVKQIFVHRIASFVQYQITPLLLYSFVSLSVVTLFTNYTLVTDKIRTFLNGIFESLGAGVGNLISEGDKLKIYAVYKELLSVRFFIASFFSTCFYTLASDFISVWLGTEYVQSSIVVLLLSIQLFYYVARGTTDIFIYGYGLYYDLWAPFTEVVLFLISSIALGFLFGLPGVMFGPIVSMSIIIYLWKPYFLYKKGFCRPFMNYWGLYFKYLANIALSFIISNYLIVLINFEVNNMIIWVLKSIIFVVLMSAFLFLFFMIDSPEFRSFCKRFAH